ncbi:hypothetical protein pb186bvf_013237 [Paramecium bursaria]
MLSEVILGTTFLLFFIYMGMSVFDKVGKKWTRKSQMDKVEERYEALRSSRREMLQHYYWAKSNGEREKEQGMESSIFKLDDELAELKNEFDALKAGQQVPLKKI